MQQGVRSKRQRLSETCLGKKNSDRVKKRKDRGKETEGTDSGWKRGSGGEKERERNKIMRERQTERGEEKGGGVC